MTYEELLKELKKLVVQWKEDANYYGAHVSYDLSSEVKAHVYQIENLLTEMDYECQS
jgi:hypothetical protein